MCVYVCRVSLYISENFHYKTLEICKQHLRIDNTT